MTEFQLDPKAQISRFLTCNFHDDETVRIVTGSAFKDGKWLPLETKAKPAIYAKVADLKQELDTDKTIQKILPGLNPRAGAWIGVNPATGMTDKDVTEMRNILIECDDIPKDEQTAGYKAAGLKFSTLTDSGGKSVHAVVRINPATSKTEYEMAFNSICDELEKRGLHPDRANKNPARLTRLPGVKRGDQEQEQLETNDKAEETDWISPILKEDKPDSVIRTVEKGIIPEGYRHNTMISYCGSVFKLMGPKKADQAEQRIRQANDEHFNPPIDEKELTKIISDSLRLAETEIWTDPSYKMPKPKKFDITEAGRQCIQDLHACLIDEKVLHIYTDDRGYICDPDEIEWHISHLFDGSLRPRIVRELHDYMRQNAEKKHDADKRYIQFNNCILDIRTRESRPLTPDLFIRQRIPWNYKPDAECVPFVDKTLSEWTLNDQDSLQLLLEWSGYNLYRGYPVHALLILIGDRRNGKSAFCDLLREMLGLQNVSAVSMESMDERFKTSAIYGKMANIADENRGTYMKESPNIKSCSAGGIIQIEFKNRTPFAYKNTAKMTFSFNEDFRIDDRCGALKARMQVLLFEADFSDPKKQNHLLLEQLTEPAAMEYFIRISIEALYRLLDQGVFTMPEKSAKWIEQQDLINNPIREFIQDVQAGCDLYSMDSGKISTDEDFFTDYEAKIIYGCYRNWATERGMKPISDQTLPRMLKHELGLIKERSTKKDKNGKRVYFYRYADQKQES